MDAQPGRACFRVGFAFLVAIVLIGRPASAQFLDEFSGPSIHPGWTFFTGDGSATIEFKQGNGYGSMLVDATRDRANIWWALIKRDIASSLDVKRLSEPGHELRLEARVRISEAPRRVQFQANTQKTVNFHEHLMEFDIPDTEWRTISWTTHRFRAESDPMDAVLNPQMIIDERVAERRGDRTLITISRPVLQRLVDGRTLGLAIRPLGPIDATLYASEHEGGRFGPRLFFNVQ